jgi:ABC-type siderophore export system fused ATPase/permease subunit
MLMSQRSYTIPLCHMLVTLGYFTLVQKRELTASIIFTAVAGFDILRWGLFSLVGSLPALTQAYVSIARVEEFLNDVRALPFFPICIT